MAFCKSEMKLIKQIFIKICYQSDVSHRYIFQNHAIYLNLLHRFYVCYIFNHFVLLYEMLSLYNRDSSAF